MSEDGEVLPAGLGWRGIHIALTSISAQMHLGIYIFLSGEDLNVGHDDDDDNM